MLGCGGGHPDAGAGPEHVTAAGMCLEQLTEATGVPLKLSNPRQPRSLRGQLAGGNRRRAHSSGVREGVRVCGAAQHGHDAGPLSQPAQILFQLGAVVAPGGGGGGVKGLSYYTEGAATPPQMCFSTCLSFCPDG